MIAKGPDDFRDAPAQTRHRMVYEIGDAGVAKLSASSFAFRGSSERDEAAMGWTREYLFRAGLSEAPIDDRDSEASVTLDMTQEILSPEPWLDEALAAIRGCYLAAQAIKEVLGYGERGSLEDAVDEAMRPPSKKVD